MADNAYQDMSVANGGYARDELLDALILRSVYVLSSAENTQTIDLQTSVMVAKGQDFFAYDSTDATTVHDGTTCLVDSNGRRYKIVDELRFPLSVLDITSTPPGSPSNGDAYLVGAAATGDWASKDDNIAVARGSDWLFIAPRVGMNVLVEDEGAYYHYSVGGSWTSGLGTLSLSADSITPVEILFPAGLSVEDTLNAPPVSPSNGQAFLVDTSPTGDFAGNPAKIALRRASAWEFVSPYDGARVYDKDSEQYLTYEDSAWAADAQFAAIEVVEVRDLSTVSAAKIFDFTGLSAYIKIIVNIIDVNAATDTCVIQTSSDDGSSFDNSSGDYVEYGNSGSLTSVSVMADDGSDRSAMVEMTGFNAATVNTMFETGLGFRGYRDAAEANNAFRLTFTSSFDLNSGTIQVLGVRG